MDLSIDSVKRNIGYKGAEFIQDGMIVGLGTGTTAFYFIEKLIDRCRKGLNIQAVASSEQSLKQAKNGGIPLIDINQITSIDMTVDGADEIDSSKRMIKGGGGALLREKIVAGMSHEMVVIVDENKLSAKLGTCKLPVEIIPFGYLSTIKKIEQLGFGGSIRLNGNGSHYHTDNCNLIFDIVFNEPREAPERDEEAIIRIPGVVDTGFFFNLAGRVIIGFLDGEIKVID